MDEPPLYVIWNRDNFPIPVAHECRLMAQTGRSPISKVSKLHVGHPARKVGSQATRGFTIPAAFFAFVRATSTSKARVTLIHRLTQLFGLPNRQMVTLGTRRITNLLLNL